MSRSSGLQAAAIYTMPERLYLVVHISRQLMSFVSVVVVFFSGDAPLVVYFAFLSSAWQTTNH